MNLMVPFDSMEVARVNATAKQIGLTPTELVRQLVLNNLRPAPESVEEAIDAKLRLWQQEDGTPLTADVSAAELFAKWAEEDAQMTQDERDAEDQLWEEIESRMGEETGLRLR